MHCHYEQVFIFSVKSFYYHLGRYRKTLYVLEAFIGNPLHVMDFRPKSVWHNDIRTTRWRMWLGKAKYDICCCSAVMNVLVDTNTLFLREIIGNVPLYCVSTISKYDGEHGPWKVIGESRNAIEPRRN